MSSQQRLRNRVRVEPQPNGTVSLVKEEETLGP